MLNFERLSRIPLLVLPTPLEKTERLSDQLGISLYLKRDDVGGLGGGGNKLRKLELILGEAQRDGVSWLITTGGPQSNHARLTAAVAARLGLGCSLFLRGTKPKSMSGNLLLNHLFGAEVTLLGECDYTEADARMNEYADRLRQRGEKPLVVPLGGATTMGTIGYVVAFREMLDQMTELGLDPDYVVVAAGTGSTCAGLVTGARLWRLETQVIGISVSWTREKLLGEVDRLAHDVSRYLGIERTDISAENVIDAYIGPGYGVPSKPGIDAVSRLARIEGIILDTTYTGKAMSGLIDLVSKGEIRKGATVVFVHTGGVPELFSQDPGRLTRKRS